MIREVSEKQAREHKAFFAQGLMAHPECFRISLSDLERAPFPTNGTPDSFTLGAFSDSGDWMGVVSFRREGHDRERLRHKGLIFWMYVSEQFGGQSVGKALLKLLLTRVKTLSDLERINLTVVGSNHRAKGLYQSLGFATYGYERQGIKWNDTYLDEEFMYLETAIL